MQSQLSRRPKLVVLLKASSALVVLRDAVVFKQRIAGKRKHGARVMASLRRMLAPSFSRDSLQPLLESHETTLDIAIGTYMGSPFIVKGPTTPRAEERDNYLTIGAKDLIVVVSFERYQPQR